MTTLFRSLHFIILTTLATAEPAHVIFDTDMANDYDRASALAALHSLAD